MVPSASFGKVRLVVACLTLIGGAPRTTAAQVVHEASHELVAVGLMRGGDVVMLATPGLPAAGLHWRFRSLDTSEVSPVRRATLASSATKLFLESPGGDLVVDLTRQRRHNSPLQHVDPSGPAPGSLSVGGALHTLPGQRFVSIRDGRASVIDDTGRDEPAYPVVDAIDAAISDDGVVLFVKPDRTGVICGEVRTDRSACRNIARPIDARGLAVLAGPSSPDGTGRFLLLAGSETQTRIVDPARGDVSPPLPRTEAALRATLMLHGLTLSESRIASLVTSLRKESAATLGAGGHAVTDWRFYRVTPDETLYAPVLEVTSSEQVFPGSFDTLAELGRTVPQRMNEHQLAEWLLDRYLRLDLATRRERCTIYFRTRSTAGSWIIEYWLYYPFDTGGLGSHLHDPEHLFVEVDKLGGAVRRVVGAAHGYVAPNNTYTADLPGASAVELPLYAMVEQHKHATAPDIDRDTVFTPGIDENEYKERAKVWGVRDVIGTNNNQLMSFDRTMSANRRPEDFLAPLGFLTRYPGAAGLRTQACCRLEPIVEVPTDREPCDAPTADCARRSVTTHPDYLDGRTILKDWVFPHAFLRAMWGVGLRRGLHTFGGGYGVDLDRVPGLRRVMPLPGRVGAEVFGWRQDLDAQHPDMKAPDPACLAECEHYYGIGFGARYEQFLSNLFGIYSAVRVYSAPLSDIWITFGPMAEMPLGHSSNVNFEAGLAFRPIGSPRFEMRVSVGVWKPRTAEVGLRARRDGEK